MRCVARPLLPAFMPGISHGMFMVRYGVVWYDTLLCGYSFHAFSCISRVPKEKLACRSKGGWVGSFLDVGCKQASSKTSPMAVNMDGPKPPHYTRCLFLVWFGLVSLPGTASGLALLDGLGLARLCRRCEHKFGKSSSSCRAGHTLERFMGTSLLQHMLFELK